MTQHPHAWKGGSLATITIDPPNGAWIRSALSRPSRTEVEIETAELLDDVRDSFGR